MHIQGGHNCILLHGIDSWQFVPVDLVRWTRDGAKATIIDQIHNHVGHTLASALLLKHGKM